MRNALRVTGVLAMAGFCAASASSGTKRKVKTNAKLPLTFDQAWKATIDLFGEHNWAIQSLERDSGIITTDWLSITDDEQARYADCGDSGITSVQRNVVRFNVRVHDDHGVSVSVGTSYKQTRSFDGSTWDVDCFSTGALEANFHRDIGSRGARIKRSPAESPLPAYPATVAAPRGFYCTSSPSNILAGSCAREKADCVRARDAGIVGVADLSECALAETARCLGSDSRCFPSEEACDFARERAGGGACVEAK